MEISEDQIKGSTFSDGNCFKDARLGFGSSNDVVGENNESIELAESLCSDSSEIVIDDEDENASSSSSSPRFTCSSSSSSSSSVSLLNPKAGPLYELTDLMAQLPIKRGLSKCYDGRSQSYTSLLTSVRSLEDLMKKERPYNKRLKLCRSYDGDLDLKPSYKVYHCLKATDFNQEDEGFE